MRITLQFLALFLLIALTGCGSTLPKVDPFKMDIQQGNVVTSKMLLKLRPGMSKSQVKFIMGTPLITDGFHNERWDYFYQLRQNGKIVKQRRVILDFEKDVLARVRGDVVPQGTPGADTGEEPVSRSIANKEVEEKGVLDSLKFWEKEKQAAETQLRNSKPLEVAVPVLVGSQKQVANSADIVEGDLDNVTKETKPLLVVPADIAVLETPEVAAIGSDVIEAELSDQKTEVEKVVNSEIQDTTEIGNQKEEANATAIVEDVASNVTEETKSLLVVPVAVVVLAAPKESVIDSNSAEAELSEPKIEAEKEVNSEIQDATEMTISKDGASEVAGSLDKAIAAPLVVVKSTEGSDEGIITTHTIKASGKEALVFRLDRNLDMSRIEKPSVKNDVEPVSVVEEALQEEMSEPGFFERMLEKIGF